MARVAVAAALGLACGCSSMSSSCSGCPSWTSRLTGLFHRNSAPAEVVGAPIDGPPIGDPGPYDAPGWLPVPQSGPPPLIPAPRPYFPNEAQRMPYQP
jgi:hypothetical protein